MPPAARHVYAWLKDPVPFRRLPELTTDLSPFGVRFRVPVRILRPGHLVRLTFEPPDGQPGMSVLSLVVRLDAEDAAASFIDLTAGDFRRLRALVDDRTGSA